MDGLITADNVKFYLIPAILIWMVFRISRAILTRPKNLPPGPVIIPYITYVKDIFTKSWQEPKTPWEETQGLIKKYGNIVCIYDHRGKANVLITGLEAIREALLKYGDVFNERPLHNPFIQILGNGAGVMTSNGHLWKVQRTFAVSKLRAFGMGKVDLEGRVMQEVNLCMDHLLSTKSQPINPYPFTSTSVGNVIFSIVASKRYDPDDPIYTRFREAIVNTLTHQLEIFEFFPFARYLPGDLTGEKRLNANRKFYLDQIHGLINEHRATLDAENVRDFIDTYLVEMDKDKLKSGSDTTFSDYQLGIMLSDLFFAGSETTTTTIVWSLLFLSLFPEVQRKAQHEIDEVVGRERQATLQDKSKLPYFTALTKELQRMANIAPFLLPHATKDDINFRGYFIPKDADVNFVIGNVMYDPEIWDSPKELRPERFLKDGKEYTPDHYIPFGVGRRLCMGEALARMEVYLFVFTILQRFTVKLPEGRPKPSTRPIFGLTSIPAPFEVCFVPRD